MTGALGELASVGTSNEDVGGRHLLVGFLSVELEGIEEGKEAFHVSAECSDEGLKVQEQREDVGYKSVRRTNQ